MSDLCRVVRRTDQDKYAFSVSVMLAFYWHICTSLRLDSGIFF